jgi:hypothetical protein
MTICKYLPLALLLVLRPIQSALAQEYVLPEKALTPFLELRERPLEKWLKANGGVEMPFNKEGDWCPQHQHYVVYRVLHLRYWFEVAPENQADWLDKLEKMLKNNAFSEVRWKIVVYSFSFKSQKKCLPQGAMQTDGDLVSHREKQKDKVERSYNWLNARHSELTKMPWGNWKNPADAEQDRSQAQQTGKDALEQLSNLLQGTEFGTGYAKLRAGIQQKMNDAERKARAGNPNYRDPIDLGLPPGTIGNDWEAPPSGNGGKPGTALPGSKSQSNDKPDGNPPSSSANPGSKGQGNPSGDPNQPAQPGDQASSSGGSQDGDAKDAKPGDNGGGKPGPFQIKVPLSKWFVTLMDIVATYFGIKEISLKVLTVAYLIAPEAFDFVGSYMAKLQHLMTPNSIEDFLNTLSDVYDYAMQFLQYGKIAYDLLTNPDLHQLVEKIDWKKFDLEKALDMGGKLGAIEKEHLQKIKKYFPVELMKGDILTNSDKLQSSLKNYAGQKIKEQATRIPGVGKYADLDKLWDCAASQDKEKCLDALKTSVKKGVFSYVPPEFRRFSDAFEDAWKGDFKSAAEKATAAEFAHRTGISVTEAQVLFSHAKTGDWKEFIKAAANTQIKQRLKSPACRQSVQAVLDGKKTFIKEELWQISRCVLEESGNQAIADQIQLYGGAAFYAATHPDQLAATFKNTLNRLNISEAALKKLLENNTDELLGLLAKGMGLTSPEAQKAFIKGDIDQAISAQTEWGMKYGLPRRDMSYYNQLGKQVKQGASNRVELLKTLVEAIRKGEITVPFDLGRMLENALQQSLR